MSNDKDPNAIFGFKESDLYLLCYDFDISESKTCIFEARNTEYILMRIILENLGFTCEKPQEITRESATLLKFNTSYPVVRYHELAENISEFLVELSQMNRNNSHIYPNKCQYLSH
jgi:hypothetical protein